MCLLFVKAFSPSSSVETFRYFTRKINDVEHEMSDHQKDNNQTAEGDGHCLDFGFDVTLNFNKMQCQRHEGSVFGNAPYVK